MTERTQPRPRPVDVVGVQFNSSGTTDGVSLAPAALRDAGLVGALLAAGVEVRDRGDLQLRPTSPVRDDARRIVRFVVDVLGR